MITHVPKILYVVLDICVIYFYQNRLKISSLRLLNIVISSDVRGMSIVLISHSSTSCKDSSWGTWKIWISNVLWNLRQWPLTSYDCLRLVPNTLSTVAINVIVPYIKNFTIQWRKAVESGRMYNFRNSCLTTQLPIVVRKQHRCQYHYFERNISPLTECMTVRSIIFSLVVTWSLTVFHRPVWHIRT